jgi:endonuclease YncB( thermonuclease family)
MRFACTVTGVHDGDGPIYCAEGPKIRLTAIAARELDETCAPSHPCPQASGDEARRELSRLATGHVLRCEKTGMSYARTTAWCWREDGVELNCAMVKSGKALAWPKFDPQGRLCRGSAP